jgi:cytochrome c
LKEKMMSRLLVLAIAAVLLGLSACDDTAEDAARTATAESHEHVAGAAAATTVLTRAQALDLAARGNCLYCHRIEFKLVGPAWQDVAAKYRGVPNAANILASHITTGGHFGWNFGTMPPRGGSTISDAEIASMARFIASLK